METIKWQKGLATRLAVNVIDRAEIDLSMQIDRIKGRLKDRSLDSKECLEISKLSSRLAKVQNLRGFFLGDA